MGIANHMRFPADMGKDTHSTQPSHDVLSVPVLTLQGLAHIARAAQGKQVCRGDVVLLTGRFGWSAGKVWFHCCMDGCAPHTLVTSHELHTADSDKHFAQCKPGREEPLLVPLEAVVCAAIHRVHRSGSLLALWPREYRDLSPVH